MLDLGREFEGYGVTRLSSSLSKKLSTVYMLDLGPGFQVYGVTRHFRVACQEYSPSLELLITV
jgi:hypothetical protein